MRPLVLAVTALAALVLASAALASYTYAGHQGWGYLQSADSTYSTGWLQNRFSKSLSGYDTTATFIDATGYNWHGTVRNTFSTTVAYWDDGPETRKAHCLSHSSGFFGSCSVYN